MSLTCDFCGKDDDQADLIIASPTIVIYLCRECIGNAADIVREQIELDKERE